ncbi:MAG: hypothetical protein J4F50_11950 [Acidimicrobiia bacterium]|nr:hypothetical protein [Acidimicrobiia bacterium]
MSPLEVPVAQDRAGPRLLDAERRIQQRLGGRRLHFDSMDKNQEPAEPPRQVIAAAREQ